MKGGKYEKSKLLQRRAHQIIPGGANTYAKGDDQYPVDAPGFIDHGSGCHVWDVDGNEFIEYGMGLRAVTLGHAFRPVVDAVAESLAGGNNFTRPAALEIDLAEELLSLVPSAEMVKFAKDGSTVTTAAVKLARAATGREMVGVCSDNPFLSYNDWFISRGPMNRGTVSGSEKLTVSFGYNDFASVESMFDRHKEDLACVILEPAKYEEPEDNFLHRLQDICRSNGVLFILDEMITGFRWSLGGGQETYGLDPDLSAFGKGMANGFAQSALVGKAEYMRLGGLNHTDERVFLLSTTHGAEVPALAATLATIRVYKSEPVIDYLYSSGERLRTGVLAHIRELNLEANFEVIGRPCNLVYVTRDGDGNMSQPFRTLFMQELIKRGILAPSFVTSYSHSDEDVDNTIRAVGEALVVYKQAIESGIDGYLVGRPVQPVFRKFS
ncbi:MAG: glutamate-1-semialdehyde 2,1-aminomutase [Rhodothermales bacterium]|nr:glutamate-1-semialdehyde 2,1-aminomutase [Rhodothermales bacterium]